MLMSDLWNEASLFGKVSLWHMDDGDIACRITFSTQGNISLEAKYFRGKSPEDALHNAIEVAKSIVNEMGAEADRLKRLIHG